MTVPVNDRRIQYTATAGQTVFPYDFKIDANTEITVLQTIYLTSVTNTLTLTTEYTVSGVGDAGGGDITLVTGAAVNDTITIVANTPLSRTTDFNQAGDFLVSDLNNQLDKLTNILQENDTTINRAVKLKDEDTTSTLEIPTATNRASKFLAFDASGDAIASAGTTETTVSSFMATVLDDTTAAAARTTLDAEQKANSLTAITTLQDDDQFIVADNSDSDNSKKITKANLVTDITSSIQDSSTTVKGIVELLTNAELATGTDATRAATAANILSLFGSSSQAGDGGYVRLPINVGGSFDEIIIQWGYTGSIGGTSSSVETFSLTFPNACLVGYCTRISSSGANSFGYSVHSLSTTSLTVQSNGAATAQVFWLAIGY